MVLYLSTQTSFLFSTQRPQVPSEELEAEAEGLKAEQSAPTEGPECRGSSQAHLGSVSNDGLTPFNLSAYAAPFTFIPAYLEVSFTTCSMVYVQHPTVRPSYSEIPIPYNAVVQLAWEWYSKVRPSFWKRSTALSTQPPMSLVHVIYPFSLSSLALDLSSSRVRRLIQGFLFPVSDVEHTWREEDCFAAPQAWVLSVFYVSLRVICQGSGERIGAVDKQHKEDFLNRRTHPLSSPPVILFRHIHNGCCFLSINMSRRTVCYFSLPRHNKLREFTTLFTTPTFPAL